jgi:hypothetical protein
MNSFLQPSKTEGNRMSSEMRRFETPPLNSQASQVKPVDPKSEELKLLEEKVRTAYAKVETANTNVKKAIDDSISEKSDPVANDKIIDDANKALTNAIDELKKSKIELASFKAPKTGLFTMFGITGGSRRRKSKKHKSKKRKSIRRKKRFV